MKISVIGMGKIGLPLAVQYALKGHTVFGIDINSETVDKVNSGLEPFPGEADLQECLKEVVKGGLLSATLKTAETVAKSDVVIVAVPLFVDDNAIPDFAAIDAAAIQIGKGLKKGTVVIFETTLPIGTTRNRIQPLIEAESGLKGENDFYLAFSPERVLTGRVFQDLRRYPKLVGGINEESSLRAIEFYENVLNFDDRPDLPKGNGVWNLGSSEAAEMAKLAETTYRDVNIGLANQFAKFASLNKIDIYKVIEACNTQPYSHIHQPGIAVGGHCIPIYPRLYLWNDPFATIVEAARTINAEMPEFFVNMLEERFGELVGKKIVVLGIAYRAGVKEIALSGIFPIVKSIEKRGGIPLVHDPLYSKLEIERLGLSSYSAGESVDYLILHTDHAEYRDWSSDMFPGLAGALDGRNSLNSNKWADVELLTLGL